MILAAALLVLQVEVTPVDSRTPHYVGPQCPYVPLLDPPHGKLFCYIWSRLGNPPDRPFVRGVDMGGWDEGARPDSGGAGGAVLLGAGVELPTLGVDRGNHHPVSL